MKFPKYSTTGAKRFLTILSTTTKTRSIEIENSRRMEGGELRPSPAVVFVATEVACTPISIDRGQRFITVRGQVSVVTYLDRLVISNSTLLVQTLLMYNLIQARGTCTQRNGRSADTIFPCSRLGIFTRVKSNFYRFSRGSMFVSVVRHSNSEVTGTISLSSVESRTRTTIGYPKKEERGSKIGTGSWCWRRSWSQSGDYIALNYTFMTRRV